MLSTILKDAKSLLTPDTWGKGKAHEGDSNAIHLVEQWKTCAGMAINRASFRHNDPCLVVPALKLYAEAAYGGGMGIPQWNDAPERTLQEVHEAFDAAIALAEAQEQITEPALVEA